MNAYFKQSLLVSFFFCVSLFSAIPLHAQSVDPILYSGKLLDNPPPTGGIALFNVGGVSGRKVLVFRPSQEKNLPLLLFFKGTGNSADISDNEFADFARQQKIILLIPEERELNFGDWDNHSEGTTYWETTNGNGSISVQNPDMMFVRALIKDAINTYQINPKKVYTAGFSNGAFFSYFVAMLLNDRIAAFSETSGGLACNTTGNPPENLYKGDDPNRAGIAVQNNCAGISTVPCAATALRPIAPKNTPRKVPTYLFHNDDDNSVSVENTCRLADQLQKMGYSNAEMNINIRKRGGGHVATLAYLNGAWNFMKNFSLP